MKKVIIIATSIIILIITVFLNFYVTSEFDQSLLDYLFSNEKITAEERQWLQENSPFTYAADNNAPPLRYINPKSGRYQGIVIDYINEISIELGVEINVKPMIWRNALNSLENGNSDLCDMFPSDKRSEKFIFSEPIYYENGVLIVSNKNDEIKSYRDLKGKSIAIQRGDYIEEYIRNRVEEVSFYYTNDYQESLYLLRKGIVDSTGGDEPVLSYFLKEMAMDNDFKIVEEPIYEMPMILAMKKDQKKLQKIINKAIISLKKKNTMLRIQQKWFGISRSIIKDNNYEILRMFASTIISILIVALVVIFIWNKELSVKVDKGLKEVNYAKRDLEIIFNNLPYYFLIINEDREILKLNTPFAEFLGKSREEIKGEHIKDLDIFEKVKPDILNYQMNKYEFLYKENHYSISSVILTNKEDNKNRVLIVIENITDEKKREEQLLHSNKIAALGQMAAGVTHEIRNPLGLIRNYIYIIKNKLYKDDEELLENIDGIDAALDSVNSFINNLLNFSRISSGAKETIYLEDFFEEIRRWSARTLEKDKIFMRFNCEGCKVYFNRESLKHVFFNLISNASDAIETKGEIKISCTSANGFTVISVKDNGKGIKKKNIKKVFDPFFTTKYPDQGTGLGLNIVYKEITRNGGTIKVNSKYGQGSEFIITLPYEGGYDEE